MSSVTCRDTLAGSRSRSSAADCHAFNLHVGCGAAVAGDTGHAEELGEITSYENRFAEHTGIVDKIYRRTECGTLWKLYRDTLGPVRLVGGSGDKDVVVHLRVSTENNIIVGCHVIHSTLYRAYDETFHPAGSALIHDTHSLFNRIGVVLLTFLGDHHIAETPEKKLPSVAVIREDAAHIARTFGNQLVVEIRIS